jgi:chromosome segregation ATPase
MKKSLPTFLGILAASALVLGPVGCTPKKVKLQLEEQTAQIQKAEAQIADLQKSIETLTGNLNETKTALEGSKAEAKKVTGQTVVLNTQVSTLQARNVELAKSVEEAKTVADQSAKKIKTLQGQVYMLTKQKAEKEETIAIKDNEITSLQTTQAGLKETITAKDNQISALNSEKAAQAEELNRTIQKKNWTIKILAILLGLAVVVAIFAFLKKRKPAPTL